MSFEPKVLLEPAVSIGFFWAAWRFGDWRKWRTYYPTILFVIANSLLSSVLQYEFPLWTYSGKHMMQNHTLTDFMITFLQFPPAVLLFLSRYPKSVMRQVVYVLLWIGLFGAIELMFVSLDMITYQNGWMFFWSLVLNAIFFISARVHHTRPLLGWAISFAFTAFVVMHFGIDLRNIK